MSRHGKRRQDTARHDTKRHETTRNDTKRHDTARTRVPEGLRRTLIQSNYFRATSEQLFQSNFRATISEQLQSNYFRATISEQLGSGLFLCRTLYWWHAPIKSRLFRAMGWALVAPPTVPTASGSSIDPATSGSQPCSRRSACALLF
jgi:hypothetical protein